MQVKVHHPLDGLNKGDRCPECHIGTLYKYEPAQLLRITGHPPYTGELLQKRHSDQPLPILMSDALSSNNPTAMPVLHAACNIPVAFELKF